MEGINCPDLSDRPTMIRMNKKPFDEGVGMHGYDGKIYDPEETEGKGRSKNMQYGSVPESKRKGVEYLALLKPW